MGESGWNGPDPKAASFEAPLLWPEAQMARKRATGSPESGQHSFSAAAMGPPLALAASRGQGQQEQAGSHRARSKNCRVQTRSTATGSLPCRRCIRSHPHKSAASLATNFQHGGPPTWSLVGTHLWLRRKRMPHQSLPAARSADSHANDFGQAAHHQQAFPAKIALRPFAALLSASLQAEVQRRHGMQPRPTHRARPVCHAGSASLVDAASVATPLPLATGIQQLMAKESC
mmetsp:Transcript_5763/g.11791  ORF Transcript_5763/g.11791 Transcript_5763/m.11791 type:complete len:231 (-) Transcript_5763:72-764(-)